VRYPPSSTMSWICVPGGWPAAMTPGRGKLALGMPQVEFSFAARPGAAVRIARTRIPASERKARERILNLSFRPARAGRALPHTVSEAVAIPHRAGRLEPGMDAMVELESEAGPKTGRLRRVLSWLPGALLLAGLVAVATHFSEGRKFALLLEQARPVWILVAALLQAGTYLCAAAVWQRVLRKGRARCTVRSLLSVAVARLFVDQVIPTAGFGGRPPLPRGPPRGGGPARRG